MHNTYDSGSQYVTRRHSLRFLSNSNNRSYKSSAHKIVYPTQ